MDGVEPQIAAELNNMDLNNLNHLLQILTKKKEVLEMVLALLLLPFLVMLVVGYFNPMPLGHLHTHTLTNTYTQCHTRLIQFSSLSVCCVVDDRWMFIRDSCINL